MFHGYDDQAVINSSSLRVRGFANLDTELISLKSALGDMQSRKTLSKPWDILRPENLRRTLTAGAFESSSEVSGSVLMGTYATVVLAQSGVSDPFRITILISCLQFLGTLVGPVLVDKIGRRPLVLIDLTIICTLNLAAGSLASAGRSSLPQQRGLAVIFIIFSFFYAIYASVQDPPAELLFCSVPFSQLT